MEYNDLDTVFEEFDFTDSIIIDICSDKFLTRVSLLIDYYWDIQEGESETRILEMSFTGCTKVVNYVSSDIVKMIELGENVDSYFTIVRIEKKSEKSIAIYNGIESCPIIQFQFEKLEIVEKENFSA